MVYILTLTTQNINKPFTYKTTNGRNITATYLGKNNTGRIVLKTIKPNGTSNTASIGNGHTTLNKNIVFIA